VSTELIPLAVLMWAVTYPSRALGLLAPGIDRLPGAALRYLQLVGPAVLAALAAVYTITITRPDGVAVIQLGIAWLAVVACIAIVRWRRSLLLGLVAAVALAVAGRAAGVP
jgi:branched-subunit amino acid transport protein